VSVLKKSQKIAGIFGPIAGLVGIVSAIIINSSWWRVTENAISDMGKVGLKYNYVLNIPIIITALVWIYYEYGVLREVKNKIERSGIGIFILGLVFFALIGIFPEGTPPHYEISWLFFIMAGMGMLTAGIGTYLEDKKIFGMITGIVFILSWILAIWAMNIFKGVAVAELIGGGGIIVWHYLGLIIKVFKESK